MAEIKDKSEMENITDKVWYEPVGVAKEINCLPDYRLCPTANKYIDTRFGRYRFEEIRVRWLIGGRLVSTELSLKHTFERPGVYYITGKIYDKHYKLLDYVIGKVVAEAGPPWSPEMLEQHPALGIWYCLIFIIIAWRYVFSFMIDTWSPVGIFLVNSMVLIMIIIGVIAIIFGQNW